MKKKILFYVLAPLWMSISASLLFAAACLAICSAIFPIGERLGLYLTTIFVIVHLILILLLRLFTIRRVKPEKGILFHGVLFGENCDFDFDSGKTIYNKWSCQILNHDMWSGLHIHDIYSILAPPLLREEYDLQLTIRKEIRRLDDFQKNVIIKFYIVVDDEKQFIDNEFLEKILKWHVVDNRQEDMVYVDIEKYFRHLINKFLPEEVEVASEEGDKHNDRLQDALDSAGFNTRVRTINTFQSIGEMIEEVGRRANSFVSFVETGKKIRVKVDINWGTE